MSNPAHHRALAPGRPVVSAVCWGVILAGCNASPYFGQAPLDRDDSGSDTNSTDSATAESTPPFLDTLPDKPVAFDAAPDSSPEVAAVQMDTQLATCGYTCDIDLVSDVHTCYGPVRVTTLADSRGTARVDMSSFTQMYLNFTICSPHGWMLHVADSPTCDGYGGDASSSSNDAEVNLINENVHFFANDFGGSVMLQNLPHYLEPTGCTTRTLWFADQKVESRGDGPLIMKESPYLLRIHPPKDVEGTPDALWYLGMNRVVWGPFDRVGSGLQHVTVCLQ